MRIDIFRSLISMLLEVVGVLWFIAAYCYAPYTVFSFLVTQWGWHVVGAVAVAFVMSIPVLGMAFAAYAATALQDWPIFYAVASFFMWVPLVALASVLRQNKRHRLIDRPKIATNFSERA